MRVALYQPDIPQNTGAILRLCACLAVPVDIIEPAGFDLSDRALRRAALDYRHFVCLRRHSTFDLFKREARNDGSRLILLSTCGDRPYLDFLFKPSDILILGRESAGVPENVHAAADARLRIPMRRDLRSLNVAVALAIVLGEGLRQTGGFSGFA